MTQRLVVLADTHIPKRARGLPFQVLEELTQADAIIHLGDFTTHDVVIQLKCFAPLYAVSGNNDDTDIRNLYGPRSVLTIGNRRIVLIHGHTGGSTALSSARSEGQSDAVLFGHSHRPFCAVENGRLLFNPGSATDKRWAPHRTYGLLELDDEIQAQIVALP
jgi:uncharacterized protein